MKGRCSAGPGVEPEQGRLGDRDPRGLQEDINFGCVCPILEDGAYIHHVSKHSEGMGTQ